MAQKKKEGIIEIQLPKEQGINVNTKIPACVKSTHMEIQSCKYT